MNKKVKWIGRQLYDDSLVEMLNRESENGWNLKKVGGVLLYFEKDPQRKYYDVDYNYGDEESERVMEEQGYHLVGVLSKIRIYCSEKPLLPLRTDPQVKTERLLEVYPKLNVIASFLLVAVNFLLLRKQFAALDYEHFLLKNHAFVNTFYYLLLNLFWFIEGIWYILVRRFIRNHFTDRHHILKWIRFLGNVNLVLVIWALLYLVFMIVKDFFKAPALGVEIVILVVGLLLFAFVNQKYFQTKADKRIRVIGYILPVIFVLGMIMWPVFGSMDSSGVDLDQRPSNHKMYLVEESKTPWLTKLAYVDEEEDKVSGEEIYIDTTISEDYIIKTYQRKIIAWFQQYEGTSWRSFVYTDLSEDISEEKTNDEQFVKVETIPEVDDAWQYQDFYILKKGHVIVIVRTDDIQNVIDHYFGQVS